MQTIVAAVAASPPGAVVDVVVNGNRALAEAMRPLITRTVAPALRLRLWFVPLGDKSHAWNAYLHRLAPPAALYAFVDGYARVHPCAFGSLRDALAAQPEALAATGLPQHGWSARKVARMMLAEGGIHGNLYALTPRAVDELRRTGYRLPLGLYRTDPTLGAALSFGLDLRERRWEPLRGIVPVATAGWDYTALRWWHPDDLRVHFKRVERQGQGALENAAISHWYGARKRPFASLPQTAVELVRRWMQEEPAAAERLLAGNARARRGWQAMQQPRDWQLATAPEELFWERQG
ncbi:MAG: hypothetical protein EOP35_16560 [Rubrivivax sp.]|nr:MAG: hypothetical protein EOP35_16560 [Rubrivivax sp.]